MKKDWKNPLLYLFSKGWQYSPNKWLVVGFWILFILAELIGTFYQPLIFANMINILQTEGINDTSLQKLFWQLVLSVLSEIVFWALHGPARVMQTSNATQIRIQYRKFFFRGVITLPLGWHSEHHTGETIDVIEKGTRALHDFSDSSFTIIYSFVRLIVSYCVLVYFNHSAAYIVAVMSIIGILVTIQFDKVLIKQYKILNRAENKISESVFDRISNISTIIILRVEKLVLDIMYKKIDEPYDLQVKNNKINEVKWFLVQMSCALMTVLVLGTYFWQVLKSNQVVVLGSVFLLMNYLDKIGNLFFQFADKYGEVLKHHAKVSSAELLSRDFKDISLSNHVLPKNWKNLSIKNLNFSYGKNGKIQLKDVELEIMRGQRIAFIGETGGGKTTMLKVIRDLYHPQSLTLSADGIHIPHGFEGINNAISLFPQVPEIFATDVRENITFGAPVSDEILQKYIDIARFTKVVDGLKDGLATVLKEKGVNLSPGQQQRLSVARGLLASEGRDIILLDEPTSSLDKLTEREVYEGIFREFKDKTIVSTVHGLHLLPLFDVIYVFDKGEIVGKGTVSELSLSCGRFQELSRAMEKVVREEN